MSKLETLNDLRMADFSTDQPDYSDQIIGKKYFLTEDEGVTKEIIQPGTGFDKPEKGDKVRVHYVGTLQSDNSEFDSSRGRGEPFVFDLGEGKVIKGWDIAVATMKKGEISKITIQSDYGYGTRGSPPKIPGGSTLIFEIELLDWKSNKDLVGDGSIIKTIVQEGEGWPLPKDEDEAFIALSVAVKQDAALKETTSGPSKRLQPVYTTANMVTGDTFTVKDGFFCKAISIAVKTMKKKERAKLIVAPSPYGFGDQGQLPDIPPHATLEIDITLLDWIRVENITADGLVTKKILNERTSEWQRPNLGATVTVAYTGRTADDSATVFDERNKENPLVFVTDEEGQAPCEGFDKAVMQMKRGEKALVTVAPCYAFGKKKKSIGSGSGDIITDSIDEGVEVVQPKACIPSESTVIYEIELLDFIKAKETWDMSADEKLESAVSHKEKGNAAFKAGKIDRAIALWNRAKQAVEYEESFKDSADKKRMALEVKKSCDVNIAAAHLKAGRASEARKAANNVLEQDSCHLKGLYRRAQSYIETGDWVEAAQDIKKALGVEPENTDFKILAKKLKVAEQASKKKEAAMWLLGLKSWGKRSLSTEFEKKVESKRLSDHISLH